MKKIRYIYKHNIFGGTFVTGRKEMPEFFQESGIKLHLDDKKDYYYSWEFAGDTCSWFTFSHTEEVEVSNEVTKIPSENKYENGMNWKNVQVKGANSRIRKETSSLKKPKPKKQPQQQIFKIEKKDDSKDNTRKRKGSS